MSRFLSLSHRVSRSLTVVFLLAFGLLAATYVGGQADAAIDPDKVSNGSGYIYGHAHSLDGGPQPNVPAYPAGVSLGIIGDDGVADTTVPFAFDFYGTTYAADTIASVSANGYLSFASPLTTPSDPQNNADLRITTPSHPLIAPFWDDLNPQNCSNGINADTFGAAPDRVFVVEWRNVCDADGDKFVPHEGFTFQTRLFETSNHIEFHYGSVVGEFGPDNNDDSSHGRSATIGLSGSSPNEYLQYAFDTSNPLPLDDGGFAIAFFPCGNGDHSVNTAAELDNAIRCYNQQTPAGDHAINILTPITHPTEPLDITQDNPAHGLTIDGGNNVLLATDPGVTLLSVNGAGPVAIDRIELSSAQYGLRTQSSSASVTITNSALSNNTEGVAVDSGTVTITGTIFTHNTGGIEVDSGTVNVTDSSMLGTDTGFGVDVNGGTVTITNFTISNHGTAVSQNTGAVNILGSTITDNLNSVHIVSGALTISDSTFTGSAGSGDGVDIDNGTVTITGTTISNHLDGLDVDGGTVTITGGTISDTGDGLDVTDGTVTITGTTFTNNSNAANIDGGDTTITGSTITGVSNNNDDAIEIDGGIVSVTDSTISNTRRGVDLGDGAVTITGTTFTDIDDHSINVDAGTAVITDSTITGVAGTGDGIRVEGGIVSVTNSTISNAKDGLDTDGGTTTIIGSTFTNNDDGFDLNGGLVTMSNSTISDSAFNGVNMSSGVLDVVNSTIANSTFNGVTNTGGTLTVTSSIIALNGSDDCDGSVIDDGNNFSDDPSCPGFALLAPGSLLALADNGGPTSTVEVLPISNAIGGGECDAALVTDQRSDGFPRQRGANCDAGAFEIELSMVFTDVPPNSAFFTDAVTWAVANAITNGTGDGTTFSPTQTLTRAQMATFLWRFAGEPAPAGSNTFIDVPAGQFYTTPVTWLAETGITTGTGDGSTFSPNDPVNRAQMATFLWRFAGEPAPTGTNNFTDVPAGQFYTTPVTWLAETGITTGTGDGTTFSPNLNLPRSQAVTFLHRFAQQPPF